MEKNFNKYSRTITYKNTTNSAMIMSSGTTPLTPDDRIRTPVYSVDSVIVCILLLTGHSG